MLPDAVLAALQRAHLGLTLGLLVVALLRRPWRRWAGAQASYALWLLPPGLALAAWLPAPAGLTLRLPPLELQGLAPAEPLATGWAWALLLQGAWLAGSALVAALLFTLHRRYAGQLRRGPHGSWRSPTGSSPGLMGAWAPRLVLPADLRQRFTAQERRWILIHERIHAVRGDNAIRLLAAALAVLAWFNPLVWWALGALRHDQELACDAAVLQRHPGHRRGYGLALLKLNGAQRLPPTASAWQPHHPLKERIMMLTTAAPHPHARRWARGALVATGVGALALLQSLVNAAPAGEKPAAARITARAACGDMPRPEISADPIPAGAYQFTVTFRIGPNGRPDTLRMTGDRTRIQPIVTAVEQAVRGYRCKPELAGTEIEQEFQFRIE